MKRRSLIRGAENVSTTNTEKHQHIRIKMEDIEKEVLSWHKKTFPNATNMAIENKLEEELIELEDRLIECNIGESKKEIADVAIVAITLLNRYGTSLLEQIRDKLEINKGRTWGEEDSQGDRPRFK